MADVRFVGPPTHGKEIVHHLRGDVVRLAETVKMCLATGDLIVHLLDRSRAGRVLCW